MEEIKTFVYFDLEATGLKSSGRPRITKISLIAVNSGDMFDLNMKLTEDLKSSNEKNKIQVDICLPRVLNKLTLCVYFMATIHCKYWRLESIKLFGYTRSIYQRP